MTVTFKSKTTGDLLMLTQHAEALMKVMGREPSASGILLPEQMPQALAALKALPAEHDAPAEPDDEEQATATEPDRSDEYVSLRQRAWPLIQMIERAQASDQAIVWGV